MLNQIKKKINNISQDGGYVELLKGSSITFVLKIIAMMFSYAAMLFITNYYGAEEWGLYSICFTLISMLILIPKFGFDNGLVRIISALNTQNKQEEIPKVILKAFLISLLITITVVFIINIFSEQLVLIVLKEPKILSYIVPISFIVLPTVVLVIFSATFQALKKTKEFMLLQSTLVNVIFFFLLILFYSLEIKISAFETYLYSVFITLILGTLMFLKILKNFKRKTLVKGEYNYSKIISTSFPMMLSGSIIMLMGWSDILILSHYQSTSDVGVYASAIKLAALTRITLMSINSIAAPKFVEYFSKNDQIGLKETVKKSTKMIFYTTAPLLLILIIFSKQILGFFGEEFTVGYLALIFLCLARFINSISGSVGYIMQMTDQQKTYQNVILIAFLINLGLNFIFIPIYGFNGAAFGSSVAMVFWNLTLVILIKKRLGFWTIYIPFLTK